MKVLSIRPSTVWYVATDLPWKQYGHRLQRIHDVRLYEVSPSGQNVGVLVAGKDAVEAEATLRDILKSYDILPKVIRETDSIRLERRASGRFWLVCKRPGTPRSRQVALSDVDYLKELPDQSFTASAVWDFGVGVFE